MENISSFEVSLNWYLILAHKGNLNMYSQKLKEYRQNSLITMETTQKLITIKTPTTWKWKAENKQTKTICNSWLKEEIQTEIYIENTQKIQEIEKLHIITYGI